MEQLSESPLNGPEARKLADFQTKMLRSAQSATRDGGFELGWAVALLLFSLGPYLNAVLPKSLWMSAWTSWMGFLPLFCGAFAPFAIPKLIQRLISWPRAGYVANPNEMKLSHLIQLMIFGSALGFTISLPWVLWSEIHRALGQSGPPNAVREIVLKSLKLLVCAGVTLYLGPKVIHKPKPHPAAQEAEMITESLKQTFSGRRRLRLVKFTLLAMFIGLAIVIGGLVFGLMYWTKSLGPIFPTREVMRPAEAPWSQLGVSSFIVASNALLYLMGSGVALKPHRWKWLVLPLMIVVPVLIAPAIPYPAINAGLTTIFDPLPAVILCLGCVWFFSGILTLILFMLRHPLP